MTDAYEVIKKEWIEDIHAEGTLLRHKKSGARVALLSTDDENKVFNIAFRTPPENSTGVAHIIEHTVLCGSEKYPLKDPFVELAKGSLNTFLNAMTYPDKTMYPVASCNAVDFRNLMEVYLDAVFYPNIYREEKIFRQEGWHYHLENADNPLTYNGVVYNEMKGVFSTPDEVLQRTIMNTLFPDTPYGVESGGDPDVIPELSYEEFLNFHRTYYHPSNSFLYLYGDMDMEEQLAWLDQAYLSKFDAIRINSAIPEQPPFAAPCEYTAVYPILEDETETEKTYLAWNAVTGNCADVTETIAFSILDYVLLDAPGAPVKQALLDAQIGKDIESTYEDGILQPYLSIIARGAEAKDKERFLQVIRKSLSDLAEQGLDPLALASGINYFEFRFREADYASFPKGLIYGIDMFDSWLYEEENPFAYLHALSVFADLKKKAGEGYFEELIRRKLLDNTHTSVIVLSPQKGLAAEKEKKKAEELAAYKAQLSEEEIRTIVEETRALQQYQEEEDTEEVIRTLPLLNREDIDRKSPLRLSAEKREVKGIPVLRHRYATNGIGYLTLLFDTRDVPEDKIPYLGLLKAVLGGIRTARHSHGELFHQINAHSGGLSFGLSVYPVAKGEQGDVGYAMMGVRAKYLYEQQAFVFEMIREILESSQLDDWKRLKEIVDSGVAGMQHALQAAGHATAATRALAVRSPLSAWNDATTGIREYRFLEDLSVHFEERKEELTETLRALMNIIFRPEHLLVSYTADAGDEEALDREIVQLAEMLTDSASAGKDPSRDALASGSNAAVLNSRCSLSAGVLDAPVKDTFPSDAESHEHRAEAFKTSGQVQYVALAGTFREAGLPYTGRLRVLKTILSYDYLWMNVRILGGAYGCMTAMKRSGDSYFVSYRDPHLKETLDTFRGLPAYLAEITLDERTMTKYIIGTISELDQPMNAAAKGAFALVAWFLGLTENDLANEREEILSCREEEIRALADYMQAVVDTASICVVGSEQAIEDERGLFDRVDNLITV